MFEKEMSNLNALSNGRHFSFSRPHVSIIANESRTLHRLLMLGRKFTTQLDASENLRLQLGASPGPSNAGELCDTASLSN